MKLHGSLANDRRLQTYILDLHFKKGMLPTRKEDTHIFRAGQLANVILILKPYFGSDLPFSESLRSFLLSS